MKANQTEVGTHTSTLTADEVRDLASSLTAESWSGCMTGYGWRGVRVSLHRPVEQDCGQAKVNRDLNARYHRVNGGDSGWNRPLPEWLEDIRVGDKVAVDWKGCSLDGLPALVKLGATDASGRIVLTVA